MENIKDYRDKELKLYAIANVFAILYIEKIVTIDILLNQDNKLMIAMVTIFNSALFLSIVYIYVLISDSLFSDNMKIRLIYLVGHLPAETVFSKNRDQSKDMRFTKQQVFEHYKDIYENMPNLKKDRYKYENAEWYKILDKHRDAKMVIVSHRDYLMCRDMTSSTVVIFLLYFVFSVILKLLPFKIESAIYLLIMYALTNIATRVKAVRFVNNVIACDLQGVKLE